MLTIYVERANGQFEAWFYDRDEGRTRRWCGETAQDAVRKARRAMCLQPDEIKVVHVQ